jgi:hypothetical protein
MSWEALAAIGSLASTVVIAISAIFALRQVDQLRRAAQLDGTMRVFAQFSDPDFIAARNFVLGELDERLKDPQYADELKTYTNVDLTRHPEYRVLMFLQLVGGLVKNNLISGPPIYEFAQYSIIKSWEHLRPIVEMQQSSMNNPYMWGTAHSLYAGAKQWIEEDARKRGIAAPQTGDPFRAEHFH